MSKVSIIMPVYNGEKYLRESIDSVLRQTLQDWELLCVDDGSVDASLKILEQYQLSDQRVKVYTQPNQGAGIARNLAMQHARGDYICFLDADDYLIDADALEVMTNLCEEKQVSVCGSCAYIEKDGKLVPNRIYKDIRELAKERGILDYRDFQFDYDYCGFIFKTAMLKKHNIKFPPYRRFQDPPFLVQAMYAAREFTFSEKALNFYRVSVVATKFNKEKVQDLLKGLRDNLLFAHEKGLKKLFHATLMRVEYEYYSLICRLLDMTDTLAIGLLEEIEAVVKCEFGREYQLRVLEFLRYGDKSFFDGYEQKLFEKLGHTQAFYLYGAGGLARKFLKWAAINGLKNKIQNIVISQKTDGQETVEEIVVKAVAELSKFKKLPVYVAVGAMFQHEIVAELQKHNIEDYNLIDSVFLEELEV